MKSLINVMQGKEGSIYHDDLGKSIATVQVLQRKHETFEREVTAMGNKVHNIHMWIPILRGCHAALPIRYMCVYSLYLKNVN